MSGSSNQQGTPRAVIHKRILDVANDKPKASLEALAAEVPSATPDLVERVLDEYGDPSEEESDDMSGSDESTESHESSNTTVEGFTQKQCETLRAIRRHPDATQRELAEILGVSGATICNRMNGVEEFNWEERQAFAEAVLDSESPAPENKSQTMASHDADRSADTDQLQERLTTLEKRVEEIAVKDGARGGLSDPELMHKVFHACMESEGITKEEEVQILKDLLQ